MRRASYTPLAEPLIVVEESGATDDEDSSSGPAPQDEARHSLVADLNPELLSPYRDLRKRSLPTPQCTSGITASQVRRLSEHGADPAATGGREAAFLATLSTTPTPTSGRRRHSVVTISRAPPTSILFGRGRRESIAAFPSAVGGRVLPPRRDSCSAVPPPPPPSTASTTAGGGSTFNLQLDIMDDIAEIKAARKVRLKMWQAPGGKEKVCEVQPLDVGTAGAASTRYHQQPPPQQAAGATTPMSRRYSDFVTSLAAPAPPPRRRASEQPPGSGAASPVHHAAGIVCSNTDLLSILSSLATSAQEINREPELAPPPAAATRKAPATADHKRKRLKDLRSNSFDISMLLSKAAAAKGVAASSPGAAGAAPASWFAKRHQPRKASADSVLQPAKSPVLVTFRHDRADASLSPAEPEAEPPPQPPPPPDHKVVWDGKSGSVVDAQVLGSAIEVFLARRGSGGGESPPPGPSPTKASPVAAGKPQPPPRQQEEEASSPDTCDTSICSTLKDLFVK